MNSFENNLSLKCELCHTSCLQCKGSAENDCSACNTTNDINTNTMYMNFIDSTQRGTNNYGNCVNSYDKCFKGN